MNICKRALTIALRHPLYLIIYIGFLSVMGATFMGQIGTDVVETSTDYQAVGARIALVDRDGSAVSEALYDALSGTDELIDVEDETFALQDALATSQVDAVMIVPAGFGEDLLDAAHTGRGLPELEVATGGDMQAAALATQRASRWVSLVAAQAALEPSLGMNEVLDAVDEASAAEPDIEMIEVSQGDSAATRFAFYLTFSSYTLTSSVVVVAGVVLATLNRPDVRRRQLASPVSTMRHGAMSIAACAILTLGVCAWVSTVGIAVSGAASLFATAPVQIVLAIVSLVVFSTVPLSMAYTLSQCGFGEEALNAIANMVGMVMSFLGGAWVPLSLMSEGVRAVAHFTPTFWMYDAITTALGAKTVTPQVLGTVATDLGIMLLFTVAIVSAGLVASRLRIREQ